MEKGIEPYQKQISALEIVNADMDRIIRSKDDNIRLLSRQLEDALFMTSKVFQQTLLQQMEDIKIKSADLAKGADSSSRSRLNEISRDIDNTMQYALSQPFSNLG